MPNAKPEDRSQLWNPPGNKFVIGTIHGAPIEIVAQYNPKEVARQAAATWNPHPNTSAKYSSTGDSNMWSEYRTTAPRTMTVELLFDGYEEGLSVATIVEDLERLTIPVDLGSRDETMRRPQLCVAVWGKQQMRCVVQSVATKLTMFDASGRPLRASCTVVLAEVDVVAMMKSDVRGAIDRVAAKTHERATTRPGHELPYPPEDSKPTRVPPPNRSVSASPAAKPAQANTVGKPSAKINPAAIEGNGPSSDQLFVNDPPAASPAPAEAPPNTVGKPSAKINPAALEGNGPSSDQLFEDDPPAATPATAAPPPNTVGKPSAQVDPNSMDGKSDVFGEQPAPDAVSGADPESPDAKRMAVYKDLE